MNKIYKVVWSKAKNCYVVASEFAKSQTKGCSGKQLLAMLIATGVMSVSGVAGATSICIDSTKDSYDIDKQLKLEDLTVVGKDSSNWGIYDVNKGSIATDTLHVRNNGELNINDETKVSTSRLFVSNNGIISSTNGTLDINDQTDEGGFNHGNIKVANINIKQGNLDNESKGGDNYYVGVIGDAEKKSVINVGTSNTGARVLGGKIVGSELNVNAQGTIKNADISVSGDVNVIGGETKSGWITEASYIHDVGGDVNVTGGGEINKKETIEIESSKDIIAVNNTAGAVSIISNEGHNSSITNDVTLQNNIDNKTKADLEGRTIVAINKTQGQVSVTADKLGDKDKLSNVRAVVSVKNGQMLGGSAHSNCILKGTIAAINNTGTADEKANVELTNAIVKAGIKADEDPSHVYIENNNVYGIRKTQGDVVAKGSYIEASTPEDATVLNGYIGKNDAYGIFNTSGNVELSEKTTLQSTGYGIVYTTGDVTVTDNSTVNAKKYGISSTEGNVAVTDNSTINATSHGIFFTRGDVKVEKSEVNTDKGVGICFVDKKLIVQDSQIIAENYSAIVTGSISDGARIVNSKVRAGLQSKDSDAQLSIANVNANSDVVGIDLSNKADASTVRIINPDIVSAGIGVKANVEAAPTAEEEPAPVTSGKVYIKTVKGDDKANTITAGVTGIEAGKDTIVEAGVKPGSEEQEETIDKAALKINVGVPDNTGVADKDNPKLTINKHVYGVHVTAGNKYTSKDVGTEVTLMGAQVDKTSFGFVADGAGAEINITNSDTKVETNGDDAITGNAVGLCAVNGGKVIAGSDTVTIQPIILKATGNVNGILADKQGENIVSTSSVNVQGEGATVGVNAANSAKNEVKNVQNIIVNATDGEALGVLARLGSTNIITGAEHIEVASDKKAADAHGIYAFGSSINKVNATNVVEDNPETEENEAKLDSTKVAINVKGKNNGYGVYSQTSSNTVSNVISIQVNEADNADLGNGKAYGIYGEGYVTIENKKNNVVAFDDGGAISVYNNGGALAAGVSADKGAKNEVSNVNKITVVSAKNTAYGVRGNYTVDDTNIHTLNNIVMKSTDENASEIFVSGNGKAYGLNAEKAINTVTGLNKLDVRSNSESYGMYASEGGINNVNTTGEEQVVVAVSGGYKVKGLYAYSEGAENHISNVAQLNVASTSDSYIVNGVEAYKRGLNEIVGTENGMQLKVTSDKYAYGVYAGEFSSNKVTNLADADAAALQVIAKVDASGVYAENGSVNELGVAQDKTATLNVIINKSENWAYAYGLEAECGGTNNVNVDEKGIFNINVSNNNEGYTVGVVAEAGSVWDDKAQQLVSLTTANNVKGVGNITVEGQGETEGVYAVARSYDLYGVRGVEPTAYKAVNTISMTGDDSKIAVVGTARQADDRLRYARSYDNVIGVGAAGENATNDVAGLASLQVTAKMPEIQPVAEDVTYAVTQAFGVVAIDGGVNKVAGAENGLKLEVSGADDAYGVGATSNGVNTVTGLDKLTVSAHGEKAYGILAEAYGNNQAAANTVTMKGANASITVTNEVDEDEAVPALLRVEEAYPDVVGAIVANGAKAKNEVSGVADIKVTNNATAVTSGIGAVYGENIVTGAEEGLKIDVEGTNAAGVFAAMENTKNTVSNVNQITVLAKNAMGIGAGGEGAVTTVSTIGKDATVTAFANDVDGSAYGVVVEKDGTVNFNLGTDTTVVARNLAKEENAADLAIAAGSVVNVAGSHMLILQDAKSIDGYKGMEEDASVTYGTLNVENGATVFAKGTVKLDTLAGDGQLAMYADKAMDSKIVNSTINAVVVKAPAINALEAAETIDKFYAQQASADRTIGTEVLTSKIIIANEGIINGVGVIENGVVKTEKNTVNQSLAEAMSSAANYARVEMNDIRKRLGDVRANVNETGLWARYENGKLSGDSTTNKFSKIQVGMDKQISEKWRAGGAFSYTKGDIDFKLGKDDSKSYSLAAYGVYTGKKGEFADFILRAGKNKNEIKDARYNGDLDASSYSASVEVGKTYSLTKNTFIEPQAELTYTHTGDSDFNYKGYNVKNKAVNSLQGRLGVVYGYTLPKDKGSIYLRAGVVHGFAGDNELTVSGNGSDKYVVDGKDTWIEYAVGGKFNTSKSTFIYADVERTSGGKINEDYRLNVGMRYSF